MQRGLLIWAASENNVTHAAHLILAGADPNYTDLDGRTALHVASSCGFEHMARYVFFSFSYTTIPVQEGTY